ncbi:MAG: AbrB/MazE/SpoVT family DNA-binding domain-containing protein [Sedimenticola sp.]
MITSIDSKGRVTVPKKIRDQLHLRTGDKVDLILGTDGRLEVIPITSSVKQLKGMVPSPKKRLTNEELEAVLR